MKEELINELYEISTYEEASDFKDYLHGLQFSNLLTEDDYEDLATMLDEFCGDLGFVIPIIDDYDWELMKISDPNLSDQ